jgi:hypothetical protein
VDEAVLVAVRDDDAELELLAVGVGEVVLVAVRDDDAELELLAVGVGEVVLVAVRDDDAELELLAVGVGEVVLVAVRDDDAELDALLLLVAEEVAENEGVGVLEGVTYAERENDRTMGMFPTAPPASSHKPRTEGSNPPDTVLEGTRALTLDRRTQGAACTVACTGLDAPVPSNARVAGYGPEQQVMYLSCSTTNHGP